MKENAKVKIVFTGGGTGGHIYPGIAVCDCLRKMACDRGVPLEIHWIGSCSGMDFSIIEKNLEKEGGSICSFHGIACGKLRRYFTFRNFIDLFKIFMGFVESVAVLKKINPDFVFSKGGFVSVPPCRAARLLRIPYFTHECDFTPGLATRLNSAGAGKVLLSYADTKKYFKENIQKKSVVTGNPVRPVFYEDNSLAGKKFLGTENASKPVLLVLGGSLGAKQINDLIVENLSELKKNFIVVHQTGKKFAEENPDVMKSGDESYKPFDFIHREMPDVIAASDIVVSRSGANSLWECAVSRKPMILIPLCGSGTRGDQVDNAKHFERNGGAVVLMKDECNSEKLFAALEMMRNEECRRKFSDSCASICGDEKPAEKIAALIFGELGL